MPDALLFSRDWEPPLAATSRVQAIQDAATPLLVADPMSDDRLVVRQQPDGSTFVSLDPADTLYFPVGSPGRPGHPRYAWTPAGTPGVSLGSPIATPTPPSPARP